ncbi:unnamed protein product [Rotaria sp. Silwood2]|nr:unnamed protein product [Rotaria sp. Silwood2]CAF4646638.1 unnamed protein product [Rotaria sp. Silwood2]
MNTRSNIFAATLIPDSENDRVIMILENQHILCMPSNGSITLQGVTNNNANQSVVADIYSAVVGGGTAVVTDVSNINCTSVGDGAAAEAVVGVTNTVDISDFNRNSIVGDGIANDADPSSNVIYLPLYEGELDLDYYDESGDEENEYDDDLYDDYEEDNYPPPANQNNIVCNCPGG